MGTQRRRLLFRSLFELLVSWICCLLLFRLRRLSRVWFRGIGRVLSCSFLRSSRGMRNMFLSEAYGIDRLGALVRRMIFRTLRKRKRVGFHPWIPTPLIIKIIYGILIFNKFFRISVLHIYNQEGAIMQNLKRCCLRYSVRCPITFTLFGALMEAFTQAILEMWTCVCGSM